MPLVARDDPGERPHADRRAAGRAAAGPRLGRQVAEERRAWPGGRRPTPSASAASGCASAPGERARRRSRRTRERRRIAPRDPERAIGHDPLDVAQVDHDLLDAPLARRVAVGRRAPRARRGTAPAWLLACAGEQVENVAPGGHAGDVSARSSVAVFVGGRAVRAGGHASGLSPAAPGTGLREKGALRYISSPVLLRSRAA